MHAVASWHSSAHGAGLGEGGEKNRLERGLHCGDEETHYFGGGIEAMAVIEGDQVQIHGEIWDTYTARMGTTCDSAFIVSRVRVNVLLRTCSD